MERFSAIKYSAYNNYQGFNSLLNRADDYGWDLDNCIFRHGNRYFKILPVATHLESPENSSVLVFGENHPTGFKYPQLTKAIKSLRLPTKFVGIPNESQGVTSCFKFGYQLTALICEQVKGKAFFTVCPKEGTWVWFVILDADNESGSNFLFVLEKVKQSLTIEAADQWYSEMKIA